MAFAAPVGAFAATQDKDSAVLDALSLRGDPAVPLLGHLLPDLAAAAWSSQYLAYVTPLFHGVALCRDLTLGQVSCGSTSGTRPTCALWVAVGYAVGRRTFAKRLVV